jgi:hypothetical protein
MLLDLNEPKSIVAWWEVFPERHGPLLADWAQRRPEVRGAIALASQMIRANPRTSVLLREAELRRAAAEVRMVQPAPPSHDEQLAQEDGRDAWDRWEGWDSAEGEDLQARQGSPSEDIRELEALEALA